MCMCVRVQVCFCVLVNLVIESVFMLMRVLVCMSVFLFFSRVCEGVFLCIYPHGQYSHVEQNPILCFCQCVFIGMSLHSCVFAIVCLFACVFFVCLCPSFTLMVKTVV